MRFSASVMVIVALVVGIASADNPTKHDFTNLKRLSDALVNFNYPEQGTKNITVWLQGGGKGTSATCNYDALDLTSAVRMRGQDFNGVDLANVAVLRCDGRTINFVDMRESIESGKPSGITVKRGDLVALLIQ